MEIFEFLINLSYAYLQILNCASLPRFLEVSEEMYALLLQELNW